MIRSFVAVDLSGRFSCETIGGIESVGTAKRRIWIELLWLVLAIRKKNVLAISVGLVLSAAPWSIHQAYQTFICEEHFIAPIVHDLRNENGLLNC